ncbi:unnamed protein product, partial [Closterium sp. NIES-53]
LVSVCVSFVLFLDSLPSLFLLLHSLPPSQPPAHSPFLPLSLLPSASSLRLLPPLPPVWSTYSFLLSGVAGIQAVKVKGVENV